MDVILASASPRRQELIKNIFSQVSVISSDVDETYSSDIPVLNIPEYLAVKKAKSVAENNKNSLTIGCDTAVFIDGELLGKPKNETEAFLMLKKLSGKTHRVVTGCALFKNGKHLSFSETTFVTFWKLTDKEIEEYIRTGECMDKAGAYGIQGKGMLLVSEIKGDYFNVVGLPVSRLKRQIDLFLEISK